MKYQNIIIGGGLSGLLAGIKLLKAGKTTAIVSSGQSALHFSSGSFELLNSVDGKRVENPLAAVASLPSEHPYSKIENIKALAEEAAALVKEAGINIHGDLEKPHYHLTPLGEVKQAWLTMDDFMTFPTPDAIPYKKVAIFNLAGFLDFYPQFLQLGLEKRGAATKTYTISNPLLERLRKSSTEMRATNIARVMDRATLDSFVNEINAKAADADVVLMPAVFGSRDSADVEFIRTKVKKPIYFISTVPISVPGMRMQLQLKEYFTRLGGVYMLGDSVNGGVIKNSRLQYITTVNHEDERFYADNFILASGSFFSHGLVSTFDAVCEPIFGLDVVCGLPRPEWADKNMYATQKFMTFGVATDSRFRVMKDGKAVENLYAAGSVLGGCDPMKEGCGAGVAMLSALKVSSNINS